MKNLAILGLLLLLAACSFKSEPVIENRYALQARELTLNGLTDLHHGRLASAEKSLQRALRSAWLSTDLKWVARAQYHVGALYLAQGKYLLADAKLSKAQINSKKSGAKVTLWRCMFALALLHQKKGLEVTQLPDLNKEMPVDIYLSAARLAHLQQRISDAKQAYNFIINQPLMTTDTYYNQAQAYLGLALLARDEKQQHQALNMTDKVLELSNKAGFPVLAAHALLLQGGQLSDVGKLERAWQIYRMLEDDKGQYDSAAFLLELAQLAQDKQRMHQWQDALDSLNYQEIKH